MVRQLVIGLFGGNRPVVGLIITLLIALLLMTDATRGSAEFSRLYTLLLIVSAIGLLLLLVLIGRSLIGLIGQFRRRESGSRLTLRLLVTLSLLSLAPTSVVYVFSLHFLHRGIDSWFDVRIEQALEDALALGRAALDTPLRDALNKTERASDRLGQVSDHLTTLALDEQRQLNAAQEMALLEINGRAIASSSADPLTIVPDLPTEEVMIQLRQGGNYVALETRGEGLQVRVVVHSPTAEGINERLLQAIYPISDRANALAANVQQAFGDYKMLAYLRTPLKYSFILILSLVLLLALLTSLWGAIYSARRITAPVRDLAEGTQAVARGDYEVQLPAAASDELGFLVDSFNAMTLRIARARDEARASAQLLAAQHAYLETVLGRLSSGVITHDEQGRLQTANEAAELILGLELKPLTGTPLDRLEATHHQLAPLTEAILRHADEQSDWNEMVTLFGHLGRMVLLLRGAHLTDKPGYQVVVFDDLTELIQAQRNAAWGEVARRLAHEIRNPLTPIQLSAERLQHKLHGVLPDQEGAILTRSTATIISQVESLKEMVNAFSDYARPPQMQLVPIDLAELVEEVLELYRDDSGRRQILFNRPTEELPAVEGDAGRLRQILHNLFKNAIEAIGENPPRPPELNLGCEERNDCRSLEIHLCDWGPGFDPAILANPYEPYVTTKPKGSGLGLAIVKKIVEEHGGLISVCNQTGAGASITIRLPIRAGNGHQTVVPGASEQP